MTSPVGSRLEARRREGRKSLVAYLMSGFPTRAGFVDLAKRTLEAGVDVLEIGMPFSDPLADGPVIQAAGFRALGQGTTLERTLEDAATLHDRFPDRPLVLMSYLNPMRAFGLPALADASRAAGLCGWVVPDRDLDRTDEIAGPARRRDLDLIPLVAPTTPARRLRPLLAGASGFVYLVSVTGVTGPRRGPPPGLRDYVARVRRATHLPLCVGFGISDADQARAAARLADGVVVGSVLLEPHLRLPFARARRETFARLRDIARGLRAAEG